MTRPDDPAADQSPVRVLRFRLEVRLPDGARAWSATLRAEEGSGAALHFDTPRDLARCLGSFGAADPAGGLR